MSRKFCNICHRKLQPFEYYTRVIINDTYKRELIICVDCKIQLNKVIHSIKKL